MATALKLYGVPLSPPFRAIAWTLLQQKTKFDVQLTVPGATTKIGSLHESYLSKTAGRSGRVPLLEEGAHIVAESPAILIYLCESRSWNKLYPAPGAGHKSLLDSYLHWHHEGTRQVARLTQPHIRPELNLSVTDEHRETAHKALKTLDQAWLGHSPYIASENDASIADMLAYEEIAQAYMTDCLNLEEYPNVQEWVKRMQDLEYHDQAHQSLMTLGSLAVESEIPMMKRLGAATKAGIGSIKDVVAGFD
jgi:glutathione S-transferase